MFSSCMVWFTKYVIALTIFLPPTEIILTITPNGSHTLPCFLDDSCYHIFRNKNNARPSTATVLFREVLSQVNSKFKSLWGSGPSKHVTLHNRRVSFLLSSCMYFSKIMLVSMVSNGANHFKILFWTFFVLMFQNIQTRLAVKHCIQQCL